MVPVVGDGVLTPRNKTACVVQTVAQARQKEINTQSQGLKCYRDANLTLSVGLSLNITDIGLTINIQTIIVSLLCAPVRYTVRKARVGLF